MRVRTITFAPVQNSESAEVTTPAPGTQAPIAKAVLGNGQIIDIPSLITKRLAIRAVQLAEMSVKQPSSAGMELGNTGFVAAPPPAGPTSSANPLRPGIPVVEPKRWNWGGATDIVMATNAPHLIGLQQGFTQGDVTRAAAMMPFPISQAHAEAFGKEIGGIVHGDPTRAILMGVSIGGLVAAGLTLYGVSRKHSFIAGSTVAVVAAILIYVFSGKTLPIAGSWKLNALSTQYQSGTPPREERLTVVQDGNCISMDRISIAEGGGRGHLTYRLCPDGSPHPLRIPNDDMAVSTYNGRNLQVRLLKNGQELGVNEFSVSEDRSRLTLVSTGRGLDGNAYRDVSVYDHE